MEYKRLLGHRVYPRQPFLKLLARHRGQFRTGTGGPQPLLRHGARARVHGLIGRVGLNGAAVVLLRQDEASGRWEARIEVRDEAGAAGGAAGGTAAGVEAGTAAGTSAGIAAGMAAGTAGAGTAGAAGALEPGELVRVRPANLCALEEGAAGPSTGGEQSGQAGFAPLEEGDWCDASSLLSL